MRFVLCVIVAAAVLSTVSAHLNNAAPMPETEGHASARAITRSKFTRSEFKALYELMVQYKYGQADNCPLVVKYELEPREEGTDMIISHREMRIGNDALDNCTDLGVQRVSLSTSLTGASLSRFLESIEGNLDKRIVFSGLRDELAGRHYYVSVVDSPRTCGGNRWFTKGETFFYFDESDTINLIAVAKITGGEPKLLSLPLVGSIRYMVAVTTGTTCIYRVQADVADLIRGSPAPSPAQSTTPIPSPTSSPSPVQTPEAVIVQPSAPPSPATEAMLSESPSPPQTQTSSDSSSDASSAASPTPTVSSPETASMSPAPTSVPTSTPGPAPTPNSASSSDPGSTNGTPAIETVSMTPGASSSDAGSTTGTAPTQMMSMTPSASSSDAGPTTGTAAIETVSMTPSASSSDAGSTTGTAPTQTMSMTPSASSSDAGSTTGTPSTQTVTPTPSASSSDAGLTNGTPAIATVSMTPGASSSDAGSTTGTAPTQTAKMTASASSSDAGPTTGTAAVETGSILSAPGVAPLPSLAQASASSSATMAMTPAAQAGSSGAAASASASSEASQAVGTTDTPSGSQDNMGNAGTVTPTPQASRSFQAIAETTVIVQPLSSASATMAPATAPPSPGAVLVPLASASASASDAGAGAVDVPLGSVQPTGSGSGTEVEAEPTPEGFIELDGVLGGNQFGSEDRNSSTVDGTSTCFPGSATVTLESGARVRMEELRLGDRVWTERGVSAVTLFTHADASRHARFTELRTAGGARIALSGGHYIFCNGELKAARRVRIGDVLETRGNGSVVGVGEVVLRGVFNPQTGAGELVVDGVRASCYTETVSVMAAHALLAPLRGGGGWLPRALVAWVGERVALLGDSIVVG